MVKAKKVVKKQVYKTNQAPKEWQRKQARETNQMVSKLPLSSINTMEPMDMIVDGSSNDVLDEAEQAFVHEHNFVNGAVANSIAQLPDPTKESLKQCDECDAPIPIGRRKALPGVRLCVDCQTDVDNANRRKQVLQGYVFKNAVVFNQ